MNCLIVRTVSLVLLSFVVFASQSKADDAVSYRVVIVGDNFNPFASNPRVDRPIGTYRTYAAASAAALKWANDHPNNYGLWRIDTIQGGSTSYGTEQSLEGLRQSIAEVKEIGRQVVQAALRKGRRPLGSTLQDYKKAIQDAYRRARDLKTTLLGQTEALTKKDFQEINRVLGEFNKEAESYNATARTEGLETVQTVSPITTTITFQNPGIVDVGPMPGGSSAPTLSGKKYSGTIGGVKANIEFKNGGTFAVTGDIEGQGRWRQGGNGVNLETETSVYRGVVGTDDIKGYRYFKDYRPYERWSVSRSQEPPSFVGTWIPAGETSTGNARTGAPGVTRERLQIRADGTVVHHDIYYGLVKCTVQISGNSISLSHDKGWGGQGLRWTFEGTLVGDKIVGTARYVDSGSDPRSVTYVRQ